LLNYDFIIFDKDSINLDYNQTDSNFDKSFRDKHTSGHKKSSLFLGTANLFFDLANA